MAAPYFQSARRNDLFNRLLESVAIPDSVKALGYEAFANCVNLTIVKIGKGLTNIEDRAFEACTYLNSVSFEGDAPTVGSDIFLGAGFINPPNVYYLPGTTGWNLPFAGTFPVRWVRPNPVILTFTPYFGVQTNQFGFRVSWAHDFAFVVLEANDDLATPSWFSIKTNEVISGWTYFIDPEWTNHPARTYRVRNR